MTKKKIEEAYKKSYLKHASGVQFDIFDLSKIRSAYETVLKSTGSVELAEQNLMMAVAKFRKN